MGFETVKASRAAERVKDSGEAHQSVSTTPESVVLARAGDEREPVDLRERAAMIRSNWIGEVTTKPSPWL